jgi:hypothetical protein
MTRTELIIQLLELALGLAFGAYFVWWSLEVLDRLTPEDSGACFSDGRAATSPLAGPRLDDPAGASTAATCGANRWRCASPRWPGYYGG